MLMQPYRRRHPILPGAGLKPSIVTCFLEELCNFAVQQSIGEIESPKELARQFTIPTIDERPAVI